MNDMTVMERRQAVTELKQLAYEAMYEPVADDGLACPWCGSVSYVRKGHNQNKTQRYRCRDCHRTFTATRDTLIGRSKPPIGKWMLYVECFIDMLPLCESARRCEVSLRTAWLMRVRLVTCIEQYQPAFQTRAGESVELDETYIRESFTGNHKKGEFMLPRPARHRGKNLKKRGLSKEQICMMTGISDDSSAFATLCGRGVLSTGPGVGIVGPRIGRGSRVVTDDALAYPRALETLGAEHEPTNAKKHGINHVNALHSSLKGFIAGFRRGSTKHLQTYLTWFLWKHSHTGDAARSLVRESDAQPCLAPHGIGTGYSRPTRTTGGVEAT